MKRVLSFVLLMLMILSLSTFMFGCKKNNPQSCDHKDDKNDGLCDYCGSKMPESGEKEPEITEYTVKFVSETGAVLHTQTVKAGEYATQPEDPVKKGFNFTGWYNNGVAWNFEKNAINSDITLKPGWQQNDDSSDVVAPDTPSPY